MYGLSLEYYRHTRTNISGPIGLSLEEYRHMYGLSLEYYTGTRGRISLVPMACLEGIHTYVWLVIRGIQAHVWLVIRRIQAHEDPYHLIGTKLNLPPNRDKYLDYWLVLKEYRHTRTLII